VRVVVVIAHPDDEVLGCGATLARLVDEDHEIRVLLALRRSDPRGVAGWDRILNDFHDSCSVLGVTPVVGEPLLEERSADSDVRELLDAVQPHVEWSDTVFTHWPGDVHQVHRSVSRAVEIATRPFRLRRNVYFFEVATSTDQSYHQQFSPQLFVTVDATHVERKLRAMGCYSTEEAPGRSVRDVRRSLESRGAQIAVPHAEAFVVARQYL
jgi:LmbE family N-acetylglucosaminyl deacetylase